MMGERGGKTKAMKRAGVILLYAVGALACAYLALYAYTMLTAPKLVPANRSSTTAIRTRRNIRDEL